MHLGYNLNVCQRLCQSLQFFYNMKAASIMTNLNIYRSYIFVHKQLV